MIKVLENKITILPHCAQILINVLFFLLIFQFEHFAFFVQQIFTIQIVWLHRQCIMYSVQFSSVQSLSRVWLFVTPWIAARQASLSITNSWSLLKLMSIKSVMHNYIFVLAVIIILPSRSLQYMWMLRCLFKFGTV